MTVHLHSVVAGFRESNREYIAYFANELILMFLVLAFCDEACLVMVLFLQYKKSHLVVVCVILLLSKYYSCCYFSFIFSC